MKKWSWLGWVAAYLTVVTVAAPPGYGQISSTLKWTRLAAGDALNGNSPAPSTEQSNAYASMSSDLTSSIPSQLLGKAHPIKRDYGYWLVTGGSYPNTTSGQRVCLSRLWLLQMSTWPSGSESVATTPITTPLTAANRWQWTEVTSDLMRGTLPPPLIYPQSHVVQTPQGGVQTPWLVVFGGTLCSTGQPNRLVYVLNLLTMTWYTPGIFYGANSGSQAVSADMLSQLGDTDTSVKWLSDKIIAFSGSTGAVAVIDLASTDVTAAVYVYSINTNATPGPRGTGHAAAMVGSNTFVLSGGLGCEGTVTGQCTNRVKQSLWTLNFNDALAGYRADVTAEFLPVAWKQLVIKTGLTSPPIGTSGTFPAKFRHSMVALNQGKLLFSFGGFESPDATRLSTTAVFIDVADESAWSAPFDAPTPSYRANGHLASLRNFLALTGGIIDTTDTSGNSTDVFITDISAYLPLTVAASSDTTVKQILIIGGSALAGLLLIGLVLWVMLRLRRQKQPGALKQRGDANSSTAHLAQSDSQMSTRSMLKQHDVSMQSLSQLDTPLSQVVGPGRQAPSQLSALHMQKVSTKSSTMSSSVPFARSATSPYSPAVSSRSTGEVVAPLPYSSPSQYSHQAQRIPPPQFTPSHAAPDTNQAIYMEDSGTQLQDAVLVLAKSSNGGAPKPPQPQPQQQQQPVPGPPPPLRTPGPAPYKPAIAPKPAVQPLVQSMQPQKPPAKQQVSMTLSDPEAGTMITENQSNVLALPGFRQLNPGTDYRLVEQLAVSGEGVIHRGQLLNDNMIGFNGGITKIVVKVPKQNNFEDDQQKEEFTAHFQQEIAIIWLLNREKNIVKLVGYSDDPPSLILKLYQYGSLKDMIVTKKTNKFRVKTADWTPQLIIAFAYDVAAGLAELHRLGIVHNDIKSANILVDEDVAAGDLYAVITDFGIASIVNQSLLGVKAFQQSKHKGASIVYASPEAIRRYRTSRNQWQEIDRNPDALKASDMYCYGMIVFELMCRRLPWAEVETAREIEQCVMNGVRPAVTFCDSVQQGIAREDGLRVLSNTMHGCWAGEPLRRPTSEAVRLALDPYKPPVRNFTLTPQNTPRK